jgi:hypothetical protein
LLLISGILKKSWFADWPRLFVAQANRGCPENQVIPLCGIGHRVIGRVP